MKRLVLKFILALCVLLSATSLLAATKYWDINGATAGAGGVAPAGTWDTGTTANWTTDSTGASAATTWTIGDDAVFSAGTDAIGSWTNTIPAGTTNFANSVTVDEGIILMGPGTLSFGPVNGVFNIVGSTNVWNISGSGSGFVTGTGGITKNGNGVLFLGGSEFVTNSSASGAMLTINAGTVDFSGETALGVVPAAARAAAVTINGGTLRYSGTAALTLNVLRGVTIGASGGTIEVVSTAGTGLSLPSAATFTLNGAGLCTKTGAGRFTLNTTANTFTGKYKVLSGTLNAAGDGRFGLIPGSVTADYFILDGATAALRSGVTTAQTWNANRGITLGASGGSLQQPGAGTTTDSLTYNGIIAGTSGGALRIQATDAAGGGSSDGIVILGGANTYDGATTIAGGMTLRLGAAGVIPDTSIITPLASGAIFDMNGFNETIKSVSGTAGTIAVGTATLTLDNPAGESYTSVFTGTPGGKVIKNGTGALTLGGSSTGWTGEWVINDGTICPAAANVFGNAAGATVTINGGKLANNSATGRSLAAAVTLTIAGDFTVDNSLFPSGTIGQILFNGGATTLKNGNRTITVNDPGGQSVNFGLAGVVGEDIAGRAIIKNGLGILALTGNNTFSGGVQLNAGSININGTVVSPLGTGALTLSGGKLNSTANRAVDTAPVTNAIVLTVDSAITTSSTAATVNLNLSGTPSGSAGTLTFRNDGADGAGDTFEPRFSGGGFNFSRPIVIDNGTVGTTRLSFFNTTVDGNQTFSGVISGNGSIRRSSGTGGTGADTTFTAPNTYSGGTTLGDGGIGFGIDSAGTPPTLTSGPLGTGTLTVSPVAAGTPKVFASGGARTVGNAITVSGSPLIIGGADDLNLSGAVNLGASVRTVQVDNTAASQFSGIISGAGGGLTKTGSGTLTLGAANAYTGDTRVGNGTLTLANSSALQNSALDMNVADAGSLSFGGLTAATLGSLKGTRDLILENGSSAAVAASIGNNGASDSYSAVLSGAGSLTKIGAGTLTLSGANTYSGGTTISAGTLLVNNTTGSGTGSGSVTVNPGGILGGTGTIAGTMTVNGTVAPGASVGALTNTVGVILNGGGTNAWEINDATGGPGIGWDLLSVTGGIDVQATSGSKFTIKLQTLSGGSPGDAANFTSPASTAYSWPIATVTDQITNFNAAAFTVNSSAFSNNVAGGHFTVDTNATQLLLVFVTNVPPVAVTDTIPRAAGVSFKVPISTLLANDTDADSAFVTDTLSLVSVSSTSTNGASVSNDLTRVYYNPINLDPTNNVLDTFTYTIQDSFGHQSSATVFVTIAASSAVPSPALSITPTGTALVTIGGIPNYPYEVQRGTNLTFDGITRQWTTNAPTQGLFTVEDDFSDIGGPPPAAFYRNRYAP